MAKGKQAKGLNKHQQRELDSEITISEAAEDLNRGNKAYAFAVIIDVCEPFKFEDKEQYVSKIKVIDETFNFQAKIANKEIKFHKFVTLHLYSKTANDAPKAKNVGDIIRIRRFNFCLSEKGELIAYETEFSNWLIYRGGKDENLKPTSFKSNWKDKNTDRTFTEYEANRIPELRNWSHNFFTQNQLKFVTWWSPLIEPANEAKAIKDRTVTAEVDIILKAVEVRSNDAQIFFVDHGGKRYLLKLKANPVLKEGTVVKLRCVNVTYEQGHRTIGLNQKSSCLVVPTHFLDAVKFNQKPGASPRASVGKTPERFSKTPDKSRAKTPADQRTPAASKSPTPARVGRTEANWTEAYDIPKNSVTGVKKDKQKPVTIKKLLQLLEDPQAHQNKRFLVDGYILGFSNDKVADIVKKSAGAKIAKFDEDVKGVDKYLYHFSVNLKDKSVEDSDQQLSAYILTNNEDQRLFDAWGLLPAQNDVKGWQSLTKAKIQAFEKRFTALQQSHQNAQFIVELLFTPKGKPFFMVRDTIFV